MSQSFRPPSSHSRNLAATPLLATGLPWVNLPPNQSRSSGSNFDSSKKECSESRSTGVAPDITEYGLIRSVGAYVAPQFSQLSPYWSGVLHTGHTPLM